MARETSMGLLRIREIVKKKKARPRGDHLRDQRKVEVEVKTLLEMINLIKGGRDLERMTLLVRSL